MSAVEEIKSRINIEDVLSEYVQLKRAGRNFKGLSPFTSEKTPSFIVSPEKQIWHDFSSGRGGDIFSFIMEAESVDFKGALDLLARKAGVDLSQFTSDKKQKGPSKERLLKAYELAVRFYQVQLKSNEEALKYLLNNRGYSKQTILTFKLGYSPNNGSPLLEYLTKKGFTNEELRSAGLVTQRAQTTVDMFRGRIMVPLADSFGQTIGFTARLLGPNENAPKYINTPATSLYDKSRHIFGLDLAKKKIRDLGYSVLVEGNLDVIASHQAGVTNTVATAGTALTEYQLKGLSRLAPGIKLAFDQDKAGISATERAIPIASKVDLNLEIITLPTGKDPDELIKKDPNLWQNAISSSVPAFEWLLEIYKNRLDLNTANGKRQFSDVLLGVVKRISDEVEKDHYLKRISDESEISLDALKNKLNNNLNQSVVIKKNKITLTNKEDVKIIDKNQQKIVDSLLALALALPSMRDHLVGLTSEMIHSDNSKKLLIFLQENTDFAGDQKDLKKLFKKRNSINNHVSDQQKMEDYVKILSLQFEELYSDVDRIELTEEAARQRAKIIEYYVKQSKVQLGKELEDASGKKEKELLEKARDLDKLLKTIK